MIAPVPRIQTCPDASSGLQPPTDRCRGASICCPCAFYSTKAPRAEVATPRPLTDEVVSPTLDIDHAPRPQLRSIALVEQNALRRALEIDHPPFSSPPLLYRGDFHWLLFLVQGLNVTG